MPSLKSFKSKRPFIMLVILLLVVGSVAAGGYYYNKFNKSQKEVTRLSNPQEAAKAQVSEAVAKVGKIVELPANETPTLATVTDPAKLKDQAFFANAKKDDQVLIYTGAKKAILYRPSTNKIIEIAPVNIGPSTTGQSTTTGQ